jgi:hypothetical protein
LSRAVKCHILTAKADGRKAMRTNQVGELAYIALAAPKSPPAAPEALRIGFERATQDADFVKESVKRNGIPYSYVAVPRGQSIIRDLAGVSPMVIDTLRAAIGGPN